MSNKIVECEICGKRWESYGEEEAWQEYIDNFGAVIATHDEGVVVCDECYGKIHPHKFPEKVQAAKDSIMNKKHN